MYAVCSASGAVGADAHPQLMDLVPVATTVPTLVQCDVRSLSHRQVERYIQRRDETMRATCVQGACRQPPRASATCSQLAVNKSMTGFSQ